MNAPEAATAALTHLLNPRAQTDACLEHFRVALRNLDDARAALARAQLDIKALAARLNLKLEEN